MTRRDAVEIDCQLCSVLTCLTHRKGLLDTLDEKDTKAQGVWYLSVVFGQRTQEKSQASDPSPAQVPALGSQKFPRQG